MSANRAWTEIRNGTFAGECLVDCFEEVAVTPAEASYSLSSPLPDEKHPDLQVSEPIATTTWEELASLPVWEDVAAMPRTLGSPDAADTGGEFIEISDGQRRFRVDFNAGSSIPQLDDALNRLRRFRKELAQKHGRSRG